MRKFFLLLLLLPTAHCFSQPDLDSSLKKKYPFIKVDSAHIRNDSALRGFFAKLELLQTSGQGKVSVVHIGDSHIQADFFSGEIRVGLQKKFGNAGRGFIFPYRLAKSNEPGDYKTSSNATWLYKRNVFTDQPLPIGVGGYTIQTSDTSALITVTLRKSDTLDYSITKLTLFHAKAEDQFDFAVFDSNMTEIGYINTTSKSENNFTSTFRFPTPVSKFILKPCPRNTSQNCAQIYGMLLENERHGLLYHMIGVNGAEFKHYNSSAYFYDQMSFLKPDLVIVSLGTNEAFNWKAYNNTAFYASIDTMVMRIKRLNPTAQILLSTPADSYKRSGRKRVKNPTVKDVRNTIIKYANDHHLAYWDLFEVGGGWGSINKWYTAGMADRYRIHFTRKGYMLQGELLNEAILESYNNYLKAK